MMNMFIVFIFCLVLFGCQTSKPLAQSKTESGKDVESALISVAGAVKGAPLTSHDLKKLNQQMREDKDAQSAVSTITQSMSGKFHTIKYCPQDGKRFAGSVKLCPDHNVELRWVDE